ncbi:MAG: DNA-directed RNA polymerase sigma-70 factor [marine bacterium B5-7]|nr:MAG: DNA-directed RNA polymerase sigma-70 factor [marine bacterium B5-7]
MIDDINLMTMTGKTQQLIINEIPRLRRYAHSLCMNREDGDDLVQSTLQRALAKVGYWQKGTSIRAWLMTIMHNLFVNNLRSKKWTAAEPLNIDELPDPRGNESERRGLLLRDLDRGLTRLSAEHREALLLVGIEQYSYKEAASIAGISVSTLTSRLHRARRELKSDMNENDTSHIRRVK